MAELPDRPPAVLLVHGAFRGGWSWQRVRPGLLDAGFDVHAPSLVGCAERRGEVESVASLDAWVEQLVGLVETEDLRDVVLVGHSQGGIVTAALSARIPERIGVLVHLDAAITAAGERAVDLGPGGRDLAPAEAWIPPRPVPAGSGGTHEFDEVTAAWVNQRLSPTPMGPSLDVVPSVPAGVRTRTAFCAGTPEGFPSRWSRARLDATGERYDVLDCGHDAPLLAPDLVVDLVVSAARDALLLPVKD